MNGIVYSIPLGYGIAVIGVIFLLFFKFKPAEFPGEIDTDRTEGYLPETIDGKAGAKQNGPLFYILAEWIGGGKGQACFFIRKLFFKPRH